MIETEYLKKLAHKLMFDMNEEEYDTLQKEFEITLKNMDKIDKIPGLSEVEPMSFPFIVYDKELREDIVNDDVTLATFDVIRNAKHTLNDQVKVPKVVDE